MAVNYKNILEKYEKIENLINKNQDIIGDEAEYYQKQLTIYSAEDIEKQIKNQIDKINNQKLKIGIVGRVKAGKSSLLNSLFFKGESILPKAATPMTAALTVLTYGEKPKVEIEFFSQEDIDDFRYKAERFEKLVKEKTEKLLEEEKKKNFPNQDVKVLIGTKEEREKKLKEKVYKRALKEVETKYQDLKAAKDQYDDIKNSNITPNQSELKQPKILTFNNYEDLQETLNKYISSKGNYTPFTKSVKLSIPRKELKDIEIVDTPGLNDPVRSRERRTEELLKECDIIFILSPSTQFLDNEDKKLMLRITRGEGIKEIFIVATQIDNELFGNLYKEKNGDLYEILNILKSKLANHGRDILESFIEEQEEIEDTFKPLLENLENRLILTSSIAEAIRLNFEKRNLWNEDMKFIWEKLTKKYSLYFNDKKEEKSIANLEQLANFSSLQTIMKDIMKRKKQILEEKLNEQTRRFSENANLFIKKLSEYCANQLNEIKNQNLENLTREKNEIERVFEEKQELINNLFLSHISDWSRDTEFEAYKIIQKELGFEIREEKKTEEKIIPRGGVLGRILDVFIKKTETITIKYISTNHVIAKLEKAIIKTDRQLEEFYKLTAPKSLKKRLREEFFGALRHKEQIGLDDKFIKIPIFEGATERLVNKIKPDFSIEKPDLPQSEGILYEEEIPKFKSKIEKFQDKLIRRYLKAIEDYHKELKEKLTSSNFSKEILGDLIKQLQQLEKQIKNKELYIKRFENILKEFDLILEDAS